jgi:hypothetical protein
VTQAIGIDRCSQPQRKAIPVAIQGGDAILSGMAPNRSSRDLRSLPKRMLADRPVGLLVCCLLMMGGSTPAHAFFCFNFGSHAGNNGYGEHRRHPFLLPPPSPYPIALMRESVRDDDRLPSIRQEKQSPEIIQGYRFRPLDRTSPLPEPPVIQTDWRH